MSVNGIPVRLNHESAAHPRALGLFTLDEIDALIEWLEGRKVWAEGEHVCVGTRLQLTFERGAVFAEIYLELD